MYEEIWKTIDSLSLYVSSIDIYVYNIQIIYKIQVLNKWMKNTDID